MLSRHQSKLPVETRLLNFTWGTPIAKRVSFRNFDKSTHPPVSRASPWILLSPNENCGRKWKTVASLHPRHTSGHTLLCFIWNNYYKRRKNQWSFSINYKKNPNFYLNHTSSVYLSVSVFLLYTVWVAHTLEWFTHTLYGQKYVDTQSKYFTPNNMFQVMIWRGYALFGRWSNKYFADLKTHCKKRKAGLWPN